MTCVDLYICLYVDCSVGKRPNKHKDTSGVLHSFFPCPWEKPIVIVCLLMSIKDKASAVPELSATNEGRIISTLTATIQLLFLLWLHVLMMYLNCDTPLAAMYRVCCQSSANK